MKFFMLLYDINKHVHSKQVCSFNKNILLFLSMSALLILSAGGLFHSPASAQNSSGATSNQQAPAAGNHITLKPVGTSNLIQQPPILTNISSKGI